MLHTVYVLDNAYRPPQYVLVNGNLEHEINKVFDRRSSKNYKFTKYKLEILQKVYGLSRPSVPSMPRLVLPMALTLPHSVSVSYDHLDLQLRRSSPEMSAICLPRAYPAIGGPWVGVPSVVFCCHAWCSWAVCSSSLIWLWLVIDWLIVFLGTMQCHCYCYCYLMVKM